MAIKQDDRLEEKFTVNHLKTRDGIRSFILTKWMKEDFNKKYRYFVEVLDDGKRVYLERPARLNKGCDFVILIEDLFLYKNGNDKPPSHKDLMNDLRQKKEKLDSKTLNHLIMSIKAIHQIKAYNVPDNHRKKIDKLSSLTLQQIQLLCKWFFIEQDITYWSGRGRDKLKEAIEEGLFETEGH